MKKPDRSVRPEYVFVVRKRCPLGERAFDRRAHSPAIPGMNFLQVTLESGCVLLWRHAVDAVELRGPRHTAVVHIPFPDSNVSDFLNFGKQPPLTSQVVTDIV
jgi:hypothetical protein